MFSESERVGLYKLNKNNKIYDTTYETALLRKRPSGASFQRFSVT